MSVLVTGSTTWTEPDSLRRVLVSLPAGTTIVTDVELATAAGIETRTFPS